MIGKRIETLSAFTQTTGMETAVRQRTQAPQHSERRKQRVTVEPAGWLAVGRGLDPLHCCSHGVLLPGVAVPLLCVAEALRAARAIAATLHGIITRWPQRKGRRGWDIMPEGASLLGWGWAELRLSFPGVGRPALRRAGVRITGDGAGVPRLRTPIYCRLPVAGSERQRVIVGVGDPSPVAEKTKSVFSAQGQPFPTGVLVIRRRPRGRSGGRWGMGGQGTRGLRVGGTTN